MSKGSKKSSSTTKPVFSPEALTMFAGSRNLVSGTLLPLEQQWRQDLSALGRGAYQQASGMLAGPLAAARQAQARLSASLSELPAHIAAPLEEGLTRQIGLIPGQLAAMAPDQLAAIVQHLLAPQFGGLLTPGQETVSKGAGSSSAEKGMAAASTAATVAAAAAMIA